MDKHNLKDHPGREDWVRPSSAEPGRQREGSRALPTQPIFPPESPRRGWQEQEPEGRAAQEMASPMGERGGAKEGPARNARGGEPAAGRAGRALPVAGACEGKDAGGAEVRLTQRRRALPGRHALVHTATGQDRGASRQPGKGELGLMPTAETDPDPRARLVSGAAGGGRPSQPLARLGAPLAQEETIDDSIASFITDGFALDSVDLFEANIK